MANVYSTAVLGLKVDVHDFKKNIMDADKTTLSALEAMRLGAANFEAKWHDITAGIKDTKRIISGIVVSRSFYSLIEAVSAASSAVLDFSMNMESAAVSMEYFMDGADKAAKAAAYIRSINEFAARTPFSSESALQLSRYIQSMGIGVNVTKSFLQVVTDTAAATGATTENLQRITLALGQMKTKGRLANEEIRQLANANVPIYEILQEELKLTGSQIANIGNYWVDADKAIVAILNGLEKRYKGAADKIADTMSGMFDTIVDDSKIIGQQVFENLYGGAESYIAKIRDKLDEYRDYVQRTSPAMLFNKVTLDIDPSGQLRNKLLVTAANIHVLTGEVGDLIRAAKPLLSIFGHSTIVTLNFMINTATAAADVISDLLGALNKLGITSDDVAETIAHFIILYKATKWMTTFGEGVLFAGRSLVSLGQSMVLTATGGKLAYSSIASLGIGIATLAAEALGLYLILNKLYKMRSSNVTDAFDERIDEQSKKLEEQTKQVEQYLKVFEDPYGSLADNKNAALDDINDISTANTKAAKKARNEWTAAFDEIYDIPDKNDTDSDELAAQKEKLLASLRGPEFIFPDIEKLIEDTTFDWGGVFDSALKDSNDDMQSWLDGMLPELIAAGGAGIAFRFARNRGAKLKEQAQAKKAGKQADGSYSGISAGEATTASVKHTEKELNNNIANIRKTAEQLRNDLKNYRTTGLPGAAPYIDAGATRLEEELTLVEKQLADLNAQRLELGMSPVDIPSEITELKGLLKEAKLEGISARIATIEKELKVKGVTEAQAAILTEELTDLRKQAAKLSTTGAEYSSMTVDQVMKRVDEAAANVVNVAKSFDISFSGTGNDMALKAGNAPGIARFAAAVAEFQSSLESLALFRPNGLALDGLAKKVQDVLSAIETTNRSATKLLGDLSTAANNIDAIGAGNTVNILAKRQARIATIANAARKDLALLYKHTKDAAAATRVTGTATGPQGTAPVTAAKNIADTTIGTKWSKLPADIDRRAYDFISEIRVAHEAYNILTEEQIKQLNDIKTVEQYIVSRSAAMRGFPKYLSEMQVAAQKAMGIYEKLAEPELPNYSIDAPISPDSKATFGELIADGVDIQRATERKELLAEITNWEKTRIARTSELLDMLAPANSEATSKAILTIAEWRLDYGNKRIADILEKLRISDASAYKLLTDALSAQQAARLAAATKDPALDGLRAIVKNLDTPAASKGLKDSVEAALTRSVQLVKGVNVKGKELSSIAASSTKLYTLVEGYGSFDNTISGLLLNGSNLINSIIKSTSDMLPVYAGSGITLEPIIRGILAKNTVNGAAVTGAGYGQIGRQPLIVQDDAVLRYLEKGKGVTPLDLDIKTKNARDALFFKDYATTNAAGFNELEDRFLRAVAPENWAELAANALDTKMAAMAVFNREFTGFDSRYIEAWKKQYNSLVHHDVPVKLANVPFSADMAVAYGKTRGLPIDDKLYEKYVADVLAPVFMKTDAGLAEIQKAIDTYIVRFTSAEAEQFMKSIPETTRTYAKLRYVLRTVDAASDEVKKLVSDFIKVTVDGKTTVYKLGAAAGKTLEESAELIDTIHAGIDSLRQVAVWSEGTAEVSAAMLRKAGYNISAMYDALGLEVNKQAAEVLHYISVNADTLAREAKANGLDTSKHFATMQDIMPASPVTAVGLKESAGYIAAELSGLEITDPVAREIVNTLKRGVSIAELPAEATRAPFANTILDTETPGLPTIVKGKIVDPPPLQASVFNMVTGKVDSAIVRFTDDIDEFAKAVESYRDIMAANEVVGTYLQTTDIKQLFKEAITAEALSKLIPADATISAFNGTNLTRFGGGFDWHVIKPYMPNARLGRDVMRMTADAVKAATGRTFTAGLNNEEVFKALVATVAGTLHDSTADVIATGQTLYRLYDGSAKVIIDGAVKQILGNGVEVGSEAALQALEKVGFTQLKEAMHKIAEAQTPEAIKSIAANVRTLSSQQSDYAMKLISQINLADQTRELLLQSIASKVQANRGAIDAVRTSLASRLDEIKALFPNAPYTKELESLLREIIGAINVLDSNVRGLNLLASAAPATGEWIQGLAALVSEGGSHAPHLPSNDVLTNYDNATLLLREAYKAAYDQAKASNPNIAENAAKQLAGSDATVKALLKATTEAVDAATTAGYYIKDLPAEIEGALSDSTKATRQTLLEAFSGAEIPDIDVDATAKAFSGSMDDVLKRGKDIADNPTLWQRIKQWFTRMGNAPSETPNVGTGVFDTDASIYKLYSDMQAASDALDAAKAAADGSDAAATKAVAAAQKAYDKASKKFYEEFIGAMSTGIRGANFKDISTTSKLFEATAGLDTTGKYTAYFADTTGFTPMTSMLGGTADDVSSALRAAVNAKLSGIITESGLTAAYKEITDGLAGITDATEKAARVTKMSDDAKQLYRAISEFEVFEATGKAADNLSDLGKSFINAVEDVRLHTVIMDAAGDVKFAGEAAETIINKSAKGLSKSFTSISSKLLNGVAGFGILDIASAVIAGFVQNAEDKAYAEGLNAKLIASDTLTGTIASELASKGYSIGEEIGGSIYNGVWQTVGQDLIVGAASSVAGTAATAITNYIAASIAAKTAAAGASAVATAAGTGAAGGSAAGPLGTIIGAVAAVVAAIGVDALLRGEGSQSTMHLYMDDIIKAIQNNTLITEDMWQDVEGKLGRTLSTDERAAIKKDAAAVAVGDVLQTYNSEHWLERDDLERALLGGTVGDKFANALRKEDFAKAAEYMQPVLQVLVEGTKNADGSITLIDSALKAAQEAERARVGTSYQVLGPRGYVTKTVDYRDLNANLLLQKSEYKIENVEAVRSAFDAIFEQGYLLGDAYKQLSKFLQSAEGKPSLGYVSNIYGGGDKTASMTDKAAGMFGGRLEEAMRDFPKYLEQYNAANGTHYSMNNLNDAAAISALWRNMDLDYDYRQGYLQTLLEKQSAAFIANNKNRQVITSFTDQDKNNRTTTYLQGASLDGVSDEAIAALQDFGLELSKETVDLTHLLDRLKAQYAGALSIGAITEQQLSDMLKPTMIKLETIPDKLIEHITGWTVASNISTVNLTTDDISILAKAGIQINGDGSVTFMRAANDEVLGTNREFSTTSWPEFSEYIRTALLDSGISTHGNGQLSIDRSKAAENAIGYTVALDTSKMSNAMKAALEDVGDIIDSETFLLTDKAIIAGTQTLTGYLTGISDAKANELGITGTNISEQFGRALTESMKVQLSGVDAMLGRNLPALASGVIIDSPIPKDWITADVAAALQQAGITLLEYGDKFVMQLGTLNNNIKDGMSPINKADWFSLPETLRQRLVDMGVIVKDAFGEVINPALAVSGENLNITGTQLMLDLNNTFEAGAGSIVSLFAENPDFWNQIPETLRMYLEQAGIITGEQLLAIQTLMDGAMLDIGNGWATTWNTLPQQSQEALIKMFGDMEVDTTNGLLTFRMVLEEADVEGMLDTEVLAPFESLPQEIKDQLTGGDASLEGQLKGSQVILGNAAKNAFASLITNSSAAATSLGSSVDEMISKLAQLERKTSTLSQLRGDAGNYDGSWFFNVGNKDYWVSDQGTTLGGFTYFPRYKQDGTLQDYGYVDNYGNTKWISIDEFNRKKASYNTRADGGITAGLTLTGERGRELAIMPDGSTRMMGLGGPEFSELPAGTQILNNQDTNSLLRYIPNVTSSRVHAYAKGSGFNIDEYIRQKLYAAVGMQDAGVYHSRPVTATPVEQQPSNAAQQIAEVLLPALSRLEGGNNNSRPIMYVGNLIADERGLRELKRKLDVIDISSARR